MNLRPDSETGTLRKLTAAAALFSGIIAMFVYLMTLAPGLYPGDGIELAAAAKVGGIAHPTGYPLYTMILWALMRALPLEAIVVSTLFSALCVAFATGISCRMLIDLMRHSLPEPMAPAATGIAFFAALSLAFAPAIWQCATVTEVYALQLLLTVCFFRALQLCLFRINEAKTAAKKKLVPLCVAAFLLGLGLAHHRMSVFLFLPFLYVAVIAARKRVAPPLPLTLLLIFLIQLPLWTYLYLPLRATCAPALNWGQPDTWARFIAHINGGDYLSQRLLSPAPGQVFTFGTFLTFAASLGAQFVTDFAEQLLPPFFAITEKVSFGHTFYYYANSALLTVAALAIAVGFVLPVIIFYRRGSAVRHWIIALALLLAQNIIFLFLYNIADISDYELIPIWGGCVLIAAAIATAAKTRRAAALIITMFALTAVYQCFMHYPFCDKSRDLREEFFSYEILPNETDTLPTDALLLTSADRDIYCSWYRQLVRGERRDVLVFGSNFIHRPWYAAYFTDEQKQKYGLRFYDSFPIGPQAFARMLREGILDANVGRRAVWTTISEKSVLDELAKYYTLTTINTTFSPLLRIEPKK